MPLRDTTTAFRWGAWRASHRVGLLAGVTAAVAVAAPAGLAQSPAGTTTAPPTAAPATGSTPIGTAPTPTKAWTARVLLPTVGRAAPSNRSRVTRRISPYAPYDQDPQVLLVLETASGPGGPWYRVLLPVRPNGTSAWVQGSAVQVRATPYRITVSIGERRLRLLRAGKVINTWKVGVGTAANPTPQGRFAISELVPQANPRGFFGPYILTLSAHSPELSDFDGGQGQVALHGTSLPGLLGRAVSHGCVRLSNAAVTRIAELVPAGAPVEIGT